MTRRPLPHLVNAMMAEIRSEEEKKVKEAEALPSHRFTWIRTLSAWTESHEERECHEQACVQAHQPFVPLPQSCFQRWMAGRGMLYFGALSI